MRQRGRKPPDRPNVIEGVFRTQPSEPPADLSLQEALIWRRVVASEPPAFFGTEAVLQLLKSFVRHQAAADAVSTVITAFQPEWLRTGAGLQRFDDLARLRDRETRAAVMVLVRLRLTNQSRYDEKTAATASRNFVSGTKPWEV